MRHHHNRPAPVLSCGRSCDLHAGVYPVVDGADEKRLDLVAKFLAVSSGHMRVVGILILPDRHDRELVGGGHALQDVEAHVARILAARVRELLQERRRRRARGWRHIDVTDRVDGAVLRGRGLHGNDRHHRHGEQNRKANAHSHPPRSLGWSVR